MFAGVLDVPLFFKYFERTLLTISERRFEHFDIFGFYILDAVIQRCSEKKCS